MPAYRDKDGKIFEEETVRSPTTSDRTAPPADAADTTNIESYEDKTRLVRPRRRGDDDDRTRVVGGRRRSRSSSADEPMAPTDPMADPVTGWLVVTHGPGKGTALALGSGTNTIGRSSAARVSVAFGDDQISREAHAIVTYDPRNRAWYVERGHGKNLTYLGDQPVLQPTTLEPHTHIQIGSTTLRFVPLCSEEFDWQDTEGDD